jgi:cytochrome bd-type quinol oxidase subunit 2
MLKYGLIRPKLIVSRTAYHVYRIAACLSIILFVGVWVAVSWGIVPEIIAPFEQPLLFIFALAAASTLAGMEIFLFRFDNSHPVKQIFWSFVLLFPLLGAAVYCFVVYSRADVFRACTEQAGSASA